MIACTGLLSGCMDMSNLPGIKPSEAKKSVVANDTAVRAEPSPIIMDLQSRQSAISSSSAYGQVASAVMSKDARVAQAELQAARLRAVAKSKNWLPSIGPSISLSSLGDLIANLVVEQVLFDNGFKKAEREFARADVEVAAVTLVEDANERVFDALSLYLDAQEGREIATMAETVLLDMRRFKWIMNERVKGGVSDGSDLNILNQKLAEIQSDQQSGLEKTSTAMAELNAMSSYPLTDVRPWVHRRGDTNGSVVGDAGTRRTITRYRKHFHGPRGILARDQSHRKRGHIQARDWNWDHRFV